MQKKATKTLAFTDDQGIPTARLDSFNDFAAYFIQGSTIRENIEDGTKQELSPDIVLYRGQSTDKELLPNIARITTALGSKDKAEAYRETEYLMLQIFKREAVSYLERKPSTEWEWIALAQHYGLPTRLLDWTENPLMALWFAVAETPKIDMDGTLCDGVLWEFIPNPRDIVDDLGPGSPLEVQDAKVIRPTHVTDRIRVQASCFTLHGYIRDDGNFVPFEKLTNTRGRLRKLIVPARMFAQARYILDQFGIDETVVFPDLGGLCRGIKWHYSRLDDEEDLEWTHKWRGWFRRLLSGDSTTPVPTARRGPKKIVTPRAKKNRS